MKNYKKEMLKSYNVRYFITREAQTTQRDDGSVRTILPTVVCKLNSWWYDCDFEGESYIGKAVCAPEDQFDEVYGKTLAYRRARAKMLKDIKKRFLGDLADIQDILVSLDNQIAKCEIKED